MRKFWLVLVFSAAGVAGFAATAHALPCITGCVFFYSDSTYSVQVGYKCWPCPGAPYVVGSMTEHELEDNPFDSCCGGGSHPGYLCDYNYNPITGQQTMVCY